MASASLQKMKSSVPAPVLNKNMNRWYLGTVFLLGMILLGFISGRATGTLALSLSAMSVIAACALWCIHLKSEDSSGLWAYLIPVLLACQLLLLLSRQMDPGSRWFEALGCGLFVYAMIWVSAIYERTPGLQSVATLALLLSVGVLAKPPLAVACALLSVLFFFRSTRRFGGFFGSALLLFTPMVLCAAAIVGINFLTAGALHAAIPQVIAVPSLKGTQDPFWPFFIREAPILCFPLAVMLARVFERKSGISDLSYFMVTAFAFVAGMAWWTPEILSALDIRIIVCAGAACLLALNPAKSVLCRAIVLTGALVPLVMLIRV